MPTPTPADKVLAHRHADRRPTRLRSRMTQPTSSNPLLLRLWHWLDALAIGGLLATVLLRKTFLSWRTNAAYLEAQLAQAGTVITPELAKEVAVGIRTPMWWWHYVLGFSLAFLLLMRLGVALRHPEQRAVANAWRALQAARVAGAGSRAEAVHVALVKASYVVAYLAMGFMVMSGINMYFAETFGIPDDTVHQIQELHEWMMWFFVAFASVHLVGVVVDELRRKSGIVSAMIHGGPPS